MKGRKTLQGQNILLVEDEYYQAVEAKHLLQDAGARVIGPTAQADDVAALLADNKVDAASIDINLGYGASLIQADLITTPQLQKPAAEKHRIEQVAALTCRSK